MLVRNTVDDVENRYQRQHPEASPYQLIWLKRFVRAWALAMEPRGGDKLSSESVRKRWNRFTAKWARLYSKAPIPEDIRESITQVRTHNRVPIQLDINIF
jgi:hypothetical protein